MSSVDWVIIGGYFAVTAGIGLAFSRRAGKSLTEFFVSGRSLPWWLAGTSMVATTFAADTPLAVTGIVARQGISGNWVWWGFLPGGLATVFFFAQLWRRSGVLTDVELVAIRYGGPPARFLRSFRAVYLGLLMNGIVMGWVNLAMIKILTGLFPDLNEYLALGICLAITVAYSTLSGLWGVVVADMFQFVIGMGGTIALAFFAVDAVGGLGALPGKLAAARHPALPDGHPALEGAPGVPWGGEPYGDADGLVSFLPTSFDAPWTLPFLGFAVYLAVNWWASWYPGAEPGGGGYVAQRMFAARDERHAMLAGLWFNVAHYALRPWPWIIAGLCSIALYGNGIVNAQGIPDPELNYVALISDHLPVGWKGLLLAAFIAAYMSTISTQLNWGASYLVNDLWRPVSTRAGDERHGVRMARLATLVILAASVVITFQMSSIAGAWKFLLSLGAGTGLVLILRWYWWRINAWSEISAMGAALVISLVLMLGAGMDPGFDFAEMVLITLFGTTLVWVAVTFLTAPETSETLRAFYERVRPPGAGWRAVSPDPEPVYWGARLGAWIVGMVVVYGTLFGVGHLLLGSATTGWTCLGAAAVATGVLSRLLDHRAFKAG